MLRSNLIFAILLALSFLFNRAQGLMEKKRVIGYATLSDADVSRIGQKNGLEMVKSLKSAFRKKSGLGFYLVNEASNLKSIEGYQYCIIEAKEKKIERIGKVYIPEYYVKMTPNGKEKHYLWDEDEEEYEEAIVDYIESLDASISEPEKALRFSLVEDPIWQLRMVIPTEAPCHCQIPPPLIPPGPGSQPAEPKCSYDEKPSKSTKPDVQELEKLARKALGDTIHRPKISTVQAGLLLLQYTDTDSAELTAQLISVAYGLGLHLDASNWNIRAGRKISRRPSKMIKKVQKGRILFSHMITLSEILADILDTVFPARITREIATAGANGLAIIQENVKPVQLRLKEWFQSFQTPVNDSLWYFASPQSFALVGVFGTLLLSIVSSLEDVEFYRRKLREYRWTLEINSENEARYMKPAMALLDANLGLLKEASQFENQDQDPRPKCRRQRLAPDRLDGAVPADLREPARLGRSSSYRSARPAVLYSSQPAPTSPHRSRSAFVLRKVLLVGLCVGILDVTNCYPHLAPYFQVEHAIDAALPPRLGDFFAALHLSLLSPRLVRISILGLPQVATLTLVGAMTSSGAGSRAGPA
ncbi:uncharacterized protein L3040_006260 [Drepanopeziza brunnea f. sp. 'multigermtubi']|uniref:uncharacterized protein n=1 Tax=Drepanopeziza brunnea f. sp. 'multigermtubi' TaxID=698441 RepID=UPI00238833DE|nr:hypothetical protein L3040_006260 [Drepanopeziza brunnea f. sp. 'multigermtubi']